MRKSLVAAGVCAACLVGSVPAPAWAQLVDEVRESEGMPEDPHNLPRYEPRPMPYSAEQVNTVAAGLVAREVLKESRRSEVLRIYGDVKADLRARLAAGEGFIEMHPSEDGKLRVPDVQYTASNVKPTAALSAEEVAYFRNAQVWVEHLVLAGGEKIDLPVLEEPKSLRDSGSKTCTIEYNADEIPALAAGLLGDSLIFHPGSRAEALKSWDAKQSELKAGLGTNGWGRVADTDEAALWPAGVEHTSSSTVADGLGDSGGSSKGLTVAFDSPFSPGEAAYLANAASYTSQRYQDCGKDIARALPAAPLSLKLALAPDKNFAIVAALVAVLGAAGAAWAGLIPGLALPF